MCVLEMFKGERTWESGTVALEALEDHLASGPVEPGLPSMPGEVEDLLRSCFSEDPSGRPASMREIAELLTGVYGRVTGRRYERDEPRAGRDTADSMNNRAVSLLDLGRTKEAGAAWSKALETEPHHVDATFNQGLAFWRSGRMDDETLIRRLKEAEASPERSFSSRYAQALIHLERGDARSASRLLDALPETALEREERRWAGRAAQKIRKSGNRLLRTFSGHHAPVRGVGFVSARQGVSAGEDGTLMVWTLNDGRVVQSIPTGMPINTMAVHPGMKGVLCGGGDFSVQDYRLRMWDLDAGRCTVEYAGHTGPVNAVRFRPGGLSALSAGDDRSIRLWDAESGRCRGTLIGHKGPVTALGVSGDGRYALSGGADQRIVLWDLVSGRKIQSVAGHDGVVTDLAVNASGDAWISAGTDRVLKLWRRSERKAHRIFSGHREAVNAVCLSNDGAFAMSAASDRTLKIWDVKSGRCIRTLEGHDSWVSALSWSRNSHYALSGGLDKTVGLWKADGRALAVRVPLRLSRVLSSETVARAADRFSRDMESAREAMEQNDPVRAVQCVRSARSREGYRRNAEAMKWWHALYSGCPRTDFIGGWEYLTLAEHGPEVEAACFNRDGQRIFAGSGQGGIRIWETGTGRALLNTVAGGGSINAGAFLPDTGAVAIGEGSRTIRVIDTESGEVRAALDGLTADARSVCVHPRGDRVFAGLNDGRIISWNLTAGRVDLMFSGHRAPVNAMCLSLDGERILSGSGDFTDQDNTLKLWDACTGECVRTFRGHERAVNAVLLTPDGGMAVSGSSDGTIGLWDVDSGQSPGRLAGHAGAVLSLALSGDGRHVLSGGFDRTVRLWSLEGRTGLRVFEGHAGPVSSVDVTPDGRFALSGDGDGSVRLWMLDWELGEPLALGWEEGVRPYIDAFVKLHGPGDPPWPDELIQGLKDDLRAGGYGWLSMAVVLDRLQAFPPVTVGIAEDRKTEAGAVREGRKGRRAWYHRIGSRIFRK